MPARRKNTGINASRVLPARVLDDHSWRFAAATREERRNDRAAKGQRRV